MVSQRIAWLSDTHFNFIKNETLIKFFHSLKNYDGIVLSGDISTGKDVCNHLNLLSYITKNVPIYFVKGNHDAYGFDFSSIEDKIKTLCWNRKDLHYLSSSEPIPLSDNTCIIGHDGWYDPFVVDHLSLLVFICDWIRIKDFKLFNPTHNLLLSKQKAIESADFLLDSAKKALENYSTIYLATHFPPWPEKNDGFLGLSYRFWTPYDSNKYLADGLFSLMLRNPDKKMVVLAGHTHQKRREFILENLELRVGHAKHGAVEIQEVIEIL